MFCYLYTIEQEYQFKYYLSTFQALIPYLSFHFDINSFSKGNVKQNKILIKRIVESLKNPIANLLGNNGYPSH